MNAQEANKRYHEHKTEIATAIAEKHFANKLESIRQANKILKAAGIAIKIDVLNTITNTHGTNPKPTIECQISINTLNEGKTHFKKPLTTYDLAEYKANLPRLNQLHQESQTTKNAEEQKDTP